ncbi:unnamed protein product, partial [Meganyctiphanes norvegica]
VQLQPPHSKMRSMRHACTLLLLVGACSALPQYPGQGGNVDDGFQQQQQNPGGLIPVTSQCLSHQDCVPYFQCVNGVINTDGEGLLDLRVKPRSTCSQPDYPDVPAICCDIPGAPVQPPFVELCPFQSVCVPETQCQGTILNAVGAMVPYATGGSWSTCGDSNIPGVCCKPPHLEVCPFQSQCVPEGQCRGTILDNTNTMVPYATGGSWSTCGDSNIPGVCCKPPHLEVCPFQAQCVQEGQCRGTILDNINNMVPYAAGGSWSTCGKSNVPGVCCINPPPHLEVCPFQSQCVPEGQCRGQILDNTNNMVPYAAGGSWSTCGNSNVPGVCCVNPPPHLEVCPNQSQCVPDGQCHGQILDNTNNMVPYVAGGLWSTCGNSNIPGVCCINPPPILNTCPGYKVCVSKGNCDGAGNVVTDGSGLLDLRLGGIHQCFVDQTTEVGFCCTPPATPPPARLVDVCPQSSVCVPELLCQDKVLDYNGVFVPYAPGILKSECGLDGNANNPGVCCLNLPPAYPPADQCGVRNTGPTGPILDQRIQSNIAYNEAQFAEFPWQAVIFFSNFTFKCGASIIGDRWLLTAAHCVNGFQPYDFKVRLGEWQVNTFDEPKPYLDVDVSAISIHPQFNPQNVHNDIAVLQLVQPVEFQYHINSICLPSLGQTFWGQRCIATGWGKDSFTGNYQHIMKKVELPTVEHQQCQSYLRKTRLGQYFQLDDSFMCAGGEENKDACKGDGGGPLACQDPATGRYVLTGITAFGIGCGNKDVPGVYADVQALLPFVQSVLNPQQQEPIKGGTGSGYGK